MMGRKARNNEAHECEVQCTKVPRRQLVAGSVLLGLATYYFFVRILGLENPWSLSRIFSIAFFSILVAEYVLEGWLWKTALGDWLGYPPDLSGDWEGEIKEEEAPKLSSYDRARYFRARIVQRGFDINISTLGYEGIVDESAISASHFLSGKVLWRPPNQAQVLGIFSVQHRQRNTHEGMNILNINDRENVLEGPYCSVNGSAGRLRLRRLEEGIVQQ